MAAIAIGRAAYRAAVLFAKTELKADLPILDGVSPSAITLPPGSWRCALDFLVAHFPEIDEATWRARMQRGRVLDEQAQPLHAGSTYVPGCTLYYYRELPAETPIPFLETVLHQDEHLVVADKPHFLPVMPAGRYVQETLLVRLKRRLGLEQLAPLHRIDRGTAGLVLFSVNPESRARYHALFAQRDMVKHYEALAPALPPGRVPHHHRSRIEPGEPFYRMRETAGPANAETLIEVAENRGPLAVYRLQLLTGRKHQLRVQMAGLGAPIVNDDLYPEIRRDADDDYSRPLQLIARSISFRDPLDGSERHFESQRQLL